MELGESPPAPKILACADYACRPLPLPARRRPSYGRRTYGANGRHHLLEDSIVQMLIEIPRLTRLRVHKLVEHKLVEHKLVEHKLVDLETPRVDDGESKLWVTWTKENGFVGTESLSPKSDPRSSAVAGPRLRGSEVKSRLSFS